MEKKHLDIIHAINKEAYDRYKDRLFINEPLSPITNEIAEAVIAGKHDDIVPKEEKEQIQAAYNKGYFTKQTRKTDPLVAKQFDMYVQKRLVQEIKAGRLPNPKDDPDFQTYKKLTK